MEKIKPEIKTDAWIRNNYYQKLGLDIVSKEREENLQKEESFSNDNYNIVIFTPRTSDQIRNRYLSRLNIHGEDTGTLRKRHQHCKNLLKKFLFSTGTTQFYARAI